MFLELNEKSTPTTRINYPDNYNQVYKDIVKIIRTNRYSIADVAFLFENTIRDLGNRAVISEIK